MLLDIGYERADRTAANPLPTVPRSPLEMMGLEFDATRAVDLTISSRRNHYEAYERAGEAMAAIVGARPENPMIALTERDLREGGRETKRAAWARAAQEARDRFPDRATEILGPDEIERQADERARAVREEAIKAGMVSSGWADVGGFVGAAGATFTDPLQLATLPFGVGRTAGATVARRILATGLTESVIAGGTQVAVEAIADPYRQRIGVEGDPLANVIAAATGGFVIGGGLRALGEAWRVIGARRSLSLDERDALAALDRETANSSSHPGGEAADAHGDILDAVTDAIRSGRSGEVEAIVARGRGVGQPAPRVPVLEVDAADVQASIRDFAERSFADRSERVLRIGRVADDVAARIEAETGIRSAGLEHVMATSEVRHALRRHGPGGAGLAADQIPITPDDIARVPEIVRTADVIRHDAVSHQGLPQIVFTKREPDGTTVVVEEVRSSRNRLAFKTMRRFRRGENGNGGPGTSGSSFGPPTLRPERGPGTAGQILSLASGGNKVYTAAGRAVQVDYEVVELGSLIPSHTDDLRANAAFPAELQPRDRSRAASEQQIRGLVANLEPERLGASTDAGTGAPVVGPDNVVESGNGRTLALRRAYVEGRADAYRAWLERQGFDLAGLREPVLIARRSTPFTADERIAFAREANVASTLDMSAAETARADAGLLDRVIDLHQGGDIALARNRDFVTAFAKALPVSVRGSLTTADGQLSQAGRRRIEAALLARAYGDEAPRLLGKLLEAQDNDIKAIGGAMTDAAASWSRLRIAAARGDIDPAMDVTADLIAAVQAVERARAAGMPVADVVAQGEMFGAGMTDTARAWLAGFFREHGFKRPAGRDAITERLSGYADEALKSQPGPNLFGEAAPAAGEVMRAVDRRAAQVARVGQEAKASVERAAQPAVIDAAVLDAQRIAATADRDIQITVREGDRETIRTIKASELLDDADERLRAAREAATCLIGGVGGAA